MKIMVLPNNKNIEELINYADSFLIGLKNYSVNLGCYFEIEEIKEIVKLLKENNKEIFISLNKNMHSSDIKNIKGILLEIEKLEINGIFYYDIGVLNLKNKLNLKTPLVWSAEHLTTNYATINFYKKHNVDYTYLSSEITLDEIIEIRQNTSVKLIVPIFGYLPMFVSERKAVTNYAKTFNIDKTTNINYIEKEENKYIIVEENDGTTAYASNILNGYNEYLTLKENKIDYVTLNEFEIDRNVFIEILKLYKKDDTKKEQIDKLLDSKTSTHFLHTKTIYKVKK